MEVSPEDLHDAPILYISGSQQLAYSPKKIEKFREFVEQGGMILGNADCGKPEFVKSFIRLGNDVFPNYEFASSRRTIPFICASNTRRATGAPGPTSWG